MAAQTRPPKKPSTSVKHMFDLSKYTDQDLLSATERILKSPGVITDKQQRELDAINEEFQRRGLELKLG